MEILKTAMMVASLLVALHVFCDNCLHMARAFRGHAVDPGLRRRKLAAWLVLAFAGLAIVASSLQGLLPAGWGLAVRNILLLDVLALGLMATAWQCTRRRPSN